MRASKEHLELIRRGVKIWNQWRKENRDIVPYLFAANLSKVNLGGVNLRGAQLIWSDLTEANLEKADLSIANLYGADLRYANLRQANLQMVNLCEAKVDGADFTGATIGGTMLGNINFNHVKGLDSVRHTGPSIIGLDTLYRSEKSIPDNFLLDAGLPETFITYVQSLITKPIEFYSCFISYSHKDEEFAQCLHARLRDAQIRVWFAPEDIKGGEKLHEQIDQAIQIHDRLLIVLSENSLQSEWVMTEIRRAREVEIREKRRKLFPIRLVDFERIQAWKCFDAENGKDLAIEVREYFVPDFSDWKNRDAFENAFGKLLRDLRAQEKG
jgi:hypothetical protein